MEGVEFTSPALQPPRVDTPRLQVHGTFRGTFEHDGRSWSARKSCHARTG